MELFVHIYIHNRPSLKTWEKTSTYSGNCPNEDVLISNDVTSACKHVEIRRIAQRGVHLRRKHAVTAVLGQTALTQLGLYELIR